MQKEKQNNNQPWHNKLDALDQLPGEARLDTNAAWNKLQQRLQPKARRKGGWFWLAAAGLLIALMVPWMITKTNTAVDKSNADNKIQPVVPAMLPERAPTIIVSNGLNDKSKPSEKNDYNAQSKISRKINTYPLKNNPVAATNENGVSKEEPVVAPTIPVKPDSFIANTVKSNAKQKLRVVHINELETTPALNTGEMVTSPSQHTNKFKINFLHSTQADGANNTNAADESSLKIFINN